MDRHPNGVSRLRTVDILEKLIAIDTISRNPNISLIDYIADLLATKGIKSTILRDATGSKANLYATVGDDSGSGVMLSGHTDVVPVDGQDWTRPPFELTFEDGLYYGRGTADMKGFVASALACALKAADRPLKTPLHLAFSYDEEIGCVGVRSMIDMLDKAPVRPAMCIVGEPTNLTVATGHKGKTGLRADCRGREGHSALAPMAFNALHLGADLINVVRTMQAEFAANGARDADYDVPYTTLHVGKMNGGTALNIVPNQCQLDFEIRNIAQDDPAAIMDRLQGEVDRLNAAARREFPEAGIAIDVFNSYPGLNTSPDAAVVSFVKSLTGGNQTIKVAFGTEGGLFSSQLQIPTVVCGPGSMAQGHKPDEFIAAEQLARCDTMLERLLETLQSGL